MTSKPETKERQEFTLGKWDNRFSGAYRQTVIAADRGLIATVSARATEEEKQANARLIAAAPAMFKALSRINVNAAYVENDTRAQLAVVWEIARAALAQARGE